MPFDRFLCNAYLDVCFRLGHGLWSYDDFELFLELEREVFRGDDDAWEIVHTLACEAPDEHTRGYIAAGPLEVFLRSSELPDLVPRVQAAVLANRSFREAIDDVWSLPDELLYWVARLEPLEPTHPLLVEVMPRFAAELSTLLRAAELNQPAAEVPTLRLFGRCACADRDCSTFYTAPRRLGPWPAMECVDLDAETGLVVVDVSDSFIVSIEVLNRTDIERELSRRLPRKP